MFVKLYDFYYNFFLSLTDVKKVCPTEMHNMRRRVSIDSSRGMSEDSSEDEDTRNQNVANKLITNRSIDQINVSELLLNMCEIEYFLFI